MGETESPAMYRWLVRIKGWMPALTFHHLIAPSQYAKTLFIKTT
jgi:hypothetical protein